MSFVNTEEPPHEGLVEVGSNSHRFNEEPFMNSDGSKQFMSGSRGLMSHRSAADIVKMHH